MIFNKKTISECAEVISGVLEQRDAEETYYAVVPCQITPKGLVAEYGKIQRESVDASCFLHVNDVIIKRLNPDCAVVFKDDNIKALPSANLFVLRPFANVIDPYYLAFILESSKIINHMSQRSGIGNAVSAITITQIRKCEIPLPPLELQRKLGKLWELHKEEERLLHKLLAENNRRLRALCKKIHI